MRNFHWSERVDGPEAPLFGTWVEGHEAWAQLIGSLRDIPDGIPEVEATPRAAAAFQAFMGGLPPAVARPPQQCPALRVFVSHRNRKADAEYAERIAERATGAGFYYWLDLHDASLQTLGRASLPLAVQSVLIAATIEIALLNCSHVIGVITTDTAGSLWVPYEFGRVKHRYLVSTQAASWWHPKVTSAMVGEYLHLGVRAATEGEVDDWLAREYPSPPPRRVPWQRGPTTALPT
jgi:hypothetical protein